MEPTSSSSPRLPPPPSSLSPSEESISHRHCHHHPHLHHYHYLCWATTLCKAFDIIFLFVLPLNSLKNPCYYPHLRTGDSEAPWGSHWFPNSAVLQNDPKVFQKSRCFRLSRKLLRQGVYWWSPGSWKCISKPYRQFYGAGELTDDSVKWHPQGHIAGSKTGP